MQTIVRRPTPVKSVFLQTLAGGNCMTIEEAFGRILKTVRNNKQISQEKLSLISGLDRTFISLLERGLRQPSLTTIFQVANALDERPEVLVKMVKDLLDENTKD